jgi:hypothetical protein
MPRQAGSGCVICSTLMIYKKYAENEIRLNIKALIAQISLFRPNIPKLEC